MRVDMRSPKLTRVARVLEVHSCMSATPVHTCCNLSRSLFTSSRVLGSTLSSSMVSTWSFRRALMGSRSATSSALSHFIACSPAARRLLVDLPMAESTSTGMCSGKERTMLATSRMRSASATDEPPNFITTEYCSRSSPGWTTVTDESAAAAAWTRIARGDRAPRRARRRAGTARCATARTGASLADIARMEWGDRGAVVSPLASWEGQLPVAFTHLEKLQGQDKPSLDLIGADRKVFGLFESEQRRFQYGCSRSEKRSPRSARIFDTPGRRGKSVSPASVPTFLGARDARAPRAARRDEGHEQDEGG